MDPILKKWVYNKSLLKKKTGKTEEKQLQELIAYILQSTNLNLIRLVNDNIDGEETIKLTITQDAIDFDSLIEKMNKWYLENTGSYLYFKENDIRFSDVFESLEANLWLDKNDYVPKKVNVLGKYKPKLGKKKSNLNFLNIYFLRKKI